jgi:predicted Fe-Mo cluster-binding NifX family protein
MDKKIRIAVASVDGIDVNSHFGRANKFFIYEMDEEGTLYQLEIRNLNAVCANGSHNKESIKKNLVKLKDCDYLLVSKIGDIPRMLAHSMGIESYEISGDIVEAIEQLLTYVKINNLFM